MTLTVSSPYAPPKRPQPSNERAGPWPNRAGARRALAACLVMAGCGEPFAADNDRAGGGNSAGSVDGGGAGDGPGGSQGGTSSGAAGTGGVNVAGDTGGSSAAGGGGRGVTGGSAGAGGGDAGTLPPVGSCSFNENSLKLPARFRDFDLTHADFEPPVDGGDQASTGLVDGMLDSDGLPLLIGSGGFITSEATFRQWYRDIPSVNARISGKLVFWNDGQGSYVNRWGSGGARWESYHNPVWCGLGNTDCANCQPLADGLRCLDPCDLFTGECTVEVEAYDGTPVFFPIDHDPGAITSATDYSIATIPPAYGGTWQDEPSGAVHNFHFTSEIRFWFLYDGATHVIELIGDDDIWVFVDGRLAIDLGGVHSPLGGTFTLDPNRASELGLTSGEFYEVTLFHAERRTSGSSFMMRLSGFHWNAIRCAQL